MFVDSVIVGKCRRKTKNRDLKKKREREKEREHAYVNEMNARQLCVYMYLKKSGSSYSVVPGEVSWKERKIRC